MLAWLIKSFLAVSSRMRLVSTQLACQNQIRVFTVFRLAQIFAQNLHKLKPVKAKYLVTLRDQSVYSHGIKSSLCPLIGNCLGRSLTCCMLKLQFILWRKAQKVTQFFELTASMTKTAREWHKKNTFERGRKQNPRTVNLSFRRREARLPEDIQQINSVSSSTEYNLCPTKLISKGDSNTTAFSVYENSDLNQI